MQLFIAHYFKLDLTCSNIIVAQDGRIRVDPYFSMRFTGESNLN